MPNIKRISLKVCVLIVFGLNHSLYAQSCPGGGAGSCPSGTYQQSCDYCCMDGDKLACECALPTAGTCQFTEIDTSYSECKNASDISNQSGYLQCIDSEGNTHNGGEAHAEGEHPCNSLYNGAILIPWDCGGPLHVPTGEVVTKPKEKNTK